MTDSTCPFCDTAPSVLANDLAYARYCKFPVSPGHILIVPFRHVADYFDTTPQEKQAIHKLVDEAKTLIDSERSPDGYNVGVNCGKAAGQGVPHVHYHLIPRYEGDMDNPRGGVRGVIPYKQKY